MSDSILDKIRSNRKRTVVPNREDTLISPKQGSEPIIQPETTTNEASKGTIASKSTIEELKVELAKIPPTRRHSAIVLDAEIDAKLTRFCKEKGVTIEVFLEAAWLQALASSGLMEKILVEAKSRYNSRKRAGKLRRLITMLSGR
ncbi:hypothetical protein [Microcoleus sp. herbarium2]|uniref:hypothetical protein n=1 Tax=Microcoleus sp. herbarium2 TaxID=3055433 RepID=UPI002FD399AB